MSLLNKVVTGKKMKPLALLVFALRGLGKTTFPMKAPKPIYITGEDNDEYDIARLQPQTWTELQSYLKAIRDDKHDYKTLVIDTIDTFEKMAQKTILVGKDAGKTMVTAKGGYSKAYEVQAQMFTDLFYDYIKPIRDNRKMNVVILAHAEKVKHSDPITCTDHDQYIVAMHKKHKALYENWVSAVLFLSYDMNRTIREDDSKIVLDSLDGKRIIYTEERPAHEGKNRFELPYEIEFEKETVWQTLTGHIKAYYEKNAAKIDAAEKAAEVAEKEMVKEIQAPSDEKLEEKNEETVIPESAQEESKAAEEQYKAIGDPKMIELGKQIDDLFPRVPNELKDKIATSVARAVNAQNPVEMERILKKIKTTINA